MNNIYRCIFYNGILMNVWFGETKNGLQRRVGFIQLIYNAIIIIIIIRNTYSIVNTM